MNRFLRAQGGTIAVTRYDDEGEPLEFEEEGVPTLVITDAWGETVGEEITCTEDEEDAGRWTATLPIIDALGVFTATFTFPDDSIVRNRFEVVGAHLFSVGDLRSWDAQLSDDTRYPTAMIVAAREAVEETFEGPKVARVAFRPRGFFETHDGSGSAALLLNQVFPTALIKATIGGDEIEASNVVMTAAGIAVRKDGSWPSGIANVTVDYEAGYESVPEPVRIAAMRYARHLLVRSAFSMNDRATAVWGESGGWRLTIAGKDGHTGLPEVDAVIDQWGRKTPGMA